MMDELPGDLFVRKFPFQWAMVSQLARNQTIALEDKHQAPSTAMVDAYHTIMMTLLFPIPFPFPGSPQSFHLLPCVLSMPLQPTVTAPSMASWDSRALGSRCLVVSGMYYWFYRDSPLHLLLEDPNQSNKPNYPNLYEYPLVTWPVKAALCRTSCGMARGEP